jgi:phage-related protein
VTTAWTAIQVIVRAVLAVLGPAIQTFTASAKASLSEFDTLLPALGELWEALEPIVMFVLKTIGVQLIVWLGIAVSVFNGIAAALGQLVEAFVGAVEGIIKILTGAAQFLTGFVDLVVALFQGNSEAVQAAWQQMGEGLRIIVEGIVEGNIALFTGLFDAVIAFTGGFVNAIITYFDNLGTELTSTIAGTMQAVADFFKDGWAEVVSIFESVYDDIIDTAVEIAEGIIETFTSIDWPAVGLSIAQGIADGIKRGASKIKNAAVNAAKAAFNAAKAFLGIKSPSIVFAEQVGAPIMQGVAQGITDNVKLIIEAFKNAADEVVSKGVKDFANKVKAVADALIKVVDAIDAVGNMVFPAQFKEKMLGLNFLIHFMVNAIKNASKAFDEDTLKLVNLYADTTKKVASAIIEVGEAFEVIANMVWPKNFQAKFRGLNFLIHFMVNAMANAAQGFTPRVLELVEHYAKAAKKVSDAVVAVGEAFAAIDSLVWPANFKAVFRGLNHLILFMVTNIKNAAMNLSDVEIERAMSLAGGTDKVATAITSIVENVQATVERMTALVAMNVPGSLQGIMNQMMAILHGLIVPSGAVGWAIGDAIVNGIIQAITAGITNVNNAIAALIGGIQFEQPQFPQAVAANGGAVNGDTGSGGRTVVIESGAFQVTISDTMDVEEFEFRTLEILRKLTE